MKRQSSCEGSRQSLRKPSLAKSDSEVSNDEADHLSRPSNLSSYAEYTESEIDDEELMPFDDISEIVTRAENDEVKCLSKFIANFKFSFPAKSKEIRRRKWDKNRAKKREKSREAQRSKAILAWTPQITS